MDDPWTSSLFLRGLSSPDSGVYTCRVGAHQTSVRVSVQGELPSTSSNPSNPRQRGSSWSVPPPSAPPPAPPPCWPAQPEEGRTYSWTGGGGASCSGRRAATAWWRAGCGWRGWCRGTLGPGPAGQGWHRPGSWRRPPSCSGWRRPRSGWSGPEPRWWWRVSKWRWGLVGVSGGSGAGGLYC